MGNKDYLKLGDWNSICDICGFKYKASEMKKRWDGLMVCEFDWEMRHPQDFIRAVPDDQAVPWVRSDKDLGADGQPVLDVSPTYNLTAGTQENDIPGGSFLYIDRGYIDADYFEELSPL